MEKGDTPEVGEDWDGHSFRDDCEWKKGHMTTLTPAAVGRALVEYSNFDRRQYTDAHIYNRVRAAVSRLPDNPISTLVEGQDFNVSRYPVGTILKIEGKIKGRFLSYNLDHWGMLAQIQDLDGAWNDEVLLYLDEELNNGTIPRYRSVLLHKEFTVGETVHDKERTGLWSQQHLAKYGQVEIWKYGQEQRRRVTEGVSVGSLAPGQVHFITTN